MFVSLRTKVNTLLTNYRQKCVTICNMLRSNVLPDSL